MEVAGGRGGAFAEKLLEQLQAVAVNLERPPFFAVAVMEAHQAAVDTLQQRVFVERRLAGLDGLTVLPQLGVGIGQRGQQIPIITANFAPNVRRPIGVSILGQKIPFVESMPFF